MSNTQNPEPNPRDGKDGDAEVPEEKRLDVTPGQPVSFEVPANTNLTINVVNEKPPEKPAGCLSTLWTCSSWLGYVLIALFVLGLIGNSLSP